MSTPNPLVPQGSLLEQQAKSKSTVQVAAFIVALHVVILGGLLFLGCKKEEKAPVSDPTDALISPPAVSGASNALPVDPFAIPTNAIAPAPDLNTNPIAPVVNTTIAPPPSLPIDPAATLPSSSAGSSEYVVQKGDIASKIAKKHGVTLKQLQEANSGLDLAKLKVGQKIQVPATAAPSPSVAAAPVDPSATSSKSSSQATHTVKGGDNLSRIAKKYGVTVKELRAANGLKSNDIKVGQKLKIPAAASGAKASTAPAPAPAPVDVPTLPTVDPGQPVKP